MLLLWFWWIVFEFGGISFCCFCFFLRTHTACCCTYGMSQAALPHLPLHQYSRYSLWVSLCTCPQRRCCALTLALFFSSIENFSSLLSLISFTRSDGVLLRRPVPFADDNGTNTHRERAGYPIVCSGGRMCMAENIIVLTDVRTVSSLLPGMY